MRRYLYNIRNSFGVGWHEHKRLFLWFGIFILAGLFLGFTFVFNPLLTQSKIHKNLIDSNILNIVAPTASGGAIVVSRIFDFLVALILIHIVCLNRWTALLCFPLIAFQAFSIVLNIYWVIARFGAISGLALALIYLFILTSVLIVFCCAVIFAMRQCADIRRCGIQINRKDFLKGLGNILLAIVAIGLLEWLIYAVILSKMIFLA